MNWRHDREQAGNDRRDNKRAFRWGAIAFVVLVVMALAYNLVSLERAGPLNPDSAVTRQHAPSPPATGGGNDSPAGPGTGAGTSTGQTSGTGAPRN